MSESLIIDGFANVHSHAFQRGLRGAVQRKDPNRNDTFWTWRERMYALATTMDLNAIERWARLTYVECLEAGFTAVGEFHYLHHGPEGEAWPDPVAASHAILRAAKQSGIRVTLLWTVYAQGGFNTPLSNAQRRFGVPNIETVWRHVDALLPHVDGQTTRLGLALHSVRAVPTTWLAALAQGARDRQLIIHAHASEQRREVNDCRNITGHSPIGLLANEGVLDQSFTAVHATWLDDEDIELLVKSGAGVALCPSTEGDLGDGVPRTQDLYSRGVPLSIGSDSHAIIDPFTELRLMAYQARAAAEARCVLAAPSGRVSPTLAHIGHTNGYRALGLEGHGDRVKIRSDATALIGCEDPSDALWLVAHPGLVDRVEVNGMTWVEEGRHVTRSTS